MYEMNSAISILSLVYSAFVLLIVNVRGKATRDYSKK